MNKTVRLEDGTVLEFLGDPKEKVKFGGSLLGEGGQGAVYNVKNLSDGKSYALKTYLKPMSPEFINNLRTNISKGAPNQSFVWPLGLTEPLGKNGDRHGYLMEKYDSKKFSAFPKIVMGRVNFPSKEMQLTALINLAEAFETLHAKGFSYQDLNDGGVLINVDNGEVLICDNDNVAPYGKNLGIQGKFKYMAPEVAINMFRPDKHSDRFSLALLMFMLLTHAHPYDGIKCLSGQMDGNLQRKVYGTEPVFIYHPTDKSNRPDPKEHANAIMAWPTLPKFIQDLFIKTFTSGMPYVGEKRTDLEIERQNRASEKEWKDALHLWMDNMVDCPNCGKGLCPTIQNNVILDEVCPHCKKKVKIQRPILIIRKNGKVERTVILEDGKIVPKSSVTSQRSGEPAFVAKKSPKRADVYGIENLLPYQWKCVQAGAKDRLVNTNDKVVALNGVKIEFDYVYSGEIIYSF